MPVKQLKAVIRKKKGSQYVVVDCPWCHRRHWMNAGSYIIPASLITNTRYKILPCGSEVELEFDGRTTAAKTKHGRNRP